jgi:hypothetical protein
MIKQLITDVAYENITLSQALTRSKLIASKINNDVFKNWIKREVEGYDDNDALPDYRTIPSPTFLIAEFPLGEMHTIEVSIPDTYDESIKKKTYFHEVLGSIKSIEDNINSIPGAQGQINLPIGLVKIYSGLYNKQVQSNRGVIRSGHRLVSRVHLKNIVEQTKQKLLDILMDLNEQFPDLENDFENNRQNNEAVSNIITNNIYAPNNNLNNAAGANATITSQYTNTLSQTQENSLKELGVNDGEIQELNTILTENNKESSTFPKKLMAWSASVASSLAGRGLYDAIPKINEFITQLM